MVLLFSMLFITEKIVTKPQIVRHVSIALWILSFMALPKLIFLTDLLAERLIELLSEFTGIITPITKQDKYADVNKMYPKVGLLSIDVPTAPIMNKGLGFEAMLISLSQVFLSIILLSYKSQAYFAPRGYPQSALMISTKLQLFGRRSGLHSIGPMSFEYMFIPSYESIKPDSTRNGNSDGNTLLKKSTAPDIAAFIHTLGSIIIIIIVIEQSIVIMML